MKQLTNLEASLRNLESAIVAFSGGVDSTFLLAVAKQVLGDRVIAVTARSSTYPASELSEACKLAKELGVEHIIIDSEELDIAGFSDNPPSRCYYCKKELFCKLKKVAQERGLACVLDGANYDDLSDYRPGSKAAAELGVRSPLREARFTKELIRICSRELKLSTADKPAYACLASRFPYHQKIDAASLLMVEKAEDFLKNEGIRGFRVRVHGKLARLEINQADRPYFEVAANREKVAGYLRELGFHYITLDLEAYRSGRMNEELSLENS